MLSYQHLFHAGNPADVHKHALLSVAFNYLTKKDKPLSYIETHAGRGLYDLDAPEAKKTGEAQVGIEKLAPLFSKDHPYVQRLSETRAQFGAMAYPGSPLIAALSLRDSDTINLAELHPQEHSALSENLRPWGAHIHPHDGFYMALAISPPTPRRGLMFIDPSYEIKFDYETIPKHLIQINRKWNVGILMLWYPILLQQTHKAMLTDLTERFPDALRHEVRFSPFHAGHRMVGSGIFIINPPYGLDAEAATLGQLFQKAFT
jgi:23S rRNA (adenine2030-N6)-methyltransferase